MFLAGVALGLVVLVALFAVGVVLGAVAALFGPTVATVTAVSLPVWRAGGCTEGSDVAGRLAHQPSAAAESPTAGDGSGGSRLTATPWWRMMTSSNTGEA